MYTLWSPVFLGEEGVDEVCCYTTVAEWNRIHEELPRAKRIFARCRSGEKDAICALGEPLEAAGNFTQEHTPLFVPSWFQTILGIEADGVAMPVEWITDEYFVNATKIVLRPHDSAFYHADAKKELEDVLTRYGVLQQGTTIPVSLQVLGGFTVIFDVIHLEPANMVLTEGEEVTIEFEEALDAERPPTPPVVRPPTPFPDDVLAMNEPIPLTGERLGGVTHAPLPDGRPWNPWR